MRKFALLRDLTIESIQDFSEEQAQEAVKDHTLVIDIEDLLIQPQIGWVLQGNTLVPGPGQSVDLKSIIKAKIKSFQDQTPELLRDMYAENTLLGITTQQSDDMFAEYMDVLVRIREGAWPTALHRLNQKTPSGFVTQEMIDAWKALLIARMV
jgi:hypothetical protein